MLFNGLTLCKSNFNLNAAQAVCNLIGFEGALSWKNGKIWRIQKNYDISPQSLACSAQYWSSCSLHIYSKSCNDHTQDVFLTCSGTRSPFTLVNYSGSQVSGLQQFLLLYNGGTVCGDLFSENSADAICKDMGYAGAQSWRLSWPFQNSEYHIALDDVNCSEGNWKSCAYTTSHDCIHSKDVYLSCKSIVVQNNCPVNYTKRLNAEKLDTRENACTSVALVICIGLIIYAMNKYFQIRKLSKEKVDNKALIKKLQDQLKEFQEEKDSKRSLELLMRTTDYKKYVNISTDEHNDDEYQTEGDQSPGSVTLRDSIDSFHCTLYCVLLLQ